MTFFYFSMIFSTAFYLCVLGLSLTTGDSLQNVIKGNSSEDVDRERAIKRETEYDFSLLINGIQWLQ